jgi:excisionase family DNA binding protein
MITPDEAAALCEVSTRTIYQWLESGELHFTETASEGLFICLSSLAGTNITPSGHRT